MGRACNQYYLHTVKQFVLTPGLQQQMFFERLQTKGGW